MALDTVREFLNENYAHVDRVIFCLFLSKDIKIYEEKMSEFFKTDLLGTFEVKSVEKLQVPYVLEQNPSRLELYSTKTRFLIMKLRHSFKLVDRTQFVSNIYANF